MYTFFAEKHGIHTMQEDGNRIIKINGGDAQLLVSGDLESTVLRALTGTTPLDTEVDSMPLPVKPYWLRSLIRVLKWYRAAISPRLGQRCVYEPSCSRYSELALRKHGLAKGIMLTAKRLHRCKPGNGGIDLP